MAKHVKDVMSCDFKTIAPDATLKEAAEMMKDGDFGFIPVAENDRMIGMITDRDIVIRAICEGKDPQNEKVRSCMTPKTYYCYDDQEVGEVCDNMAEIKVRRFPVVNRDKRLVGIVSLGDVSQQATNAESGNAIQEITVEVANKPHSRQAA